MRILLDEQLPRQLAPHLVGHDVRTFQQESWAGLPLIPAGLTAIATVRNIASNDPITEGNLRAMFDARGETELHNMTPYIVSKLNRFYAPAAAHRGAHGMHSLIDDAVRRSQFVVSPSMGEDDGSLYRVENLF